MIRWGYAFIDRPAERFEESCAFWEELTQTRLSSRRGERGEFATFLPASGDAYLKTQAVLEPGHDIHLDLCVDELAELVSQAPVISELDDVIVHRSPAGFPFCAVPWAGEREAHGIKVAARLEVTPADYPAESAFWTGLLRGASLPFEVTVTAGQVTRSYLDLSPGDPAPGGLKRDPGNGIYRLVS